MTNPHSHTDNRMAVEICLLKREKGKCCFIRTSHRQLPTSLCRLVVHRGQVTLPCRCISFGLLSAVTAQAIVHLSRFKVKGRFAVGQPLDDAHYSRWVSPLSTPFFKKFFADIKKCRQTLANTRKNFFKKFLSKHLNGCAERTKTAKTIHAALQGICLKFNTMLNLSIG